VLKEKQPHDMADVLLSLKHAVVHPGQAAGQLSPCGNFPTSYNAGQQCSAQGPYQGPSASLSYTVHPHQVRSRTDGHSGINQRTVTAPGRSDVYVSPSPETQEPRGSVEVEALCYKAESLGPES
jgi:hypothetical protein